MRIWKSNIIVSDDLGQCLQCSIRGEGEYPQCTVLVISVHCRPIATLPPTKTKSKDPQMLSCTKLCSNYSQKLLDRNQGRFCRKNIRLSGFDGLQPPDMVACLPGACEKANPLVACSSGLGNAVSVLADGTGYVKELRPWCQCNIIERLLHLRLVHSIVHRMFPLLLA